VGSKSSAGVSDGDCGDCSRIFETEIVQSRASSSHADWSKADRNRNDVNGKLNWQCDTALRGGFDLRKSFPTCGLSKAMIFKFHTRNKHKISSGLANQIFKKCSNFDLWQYFLKNGRVMMY